MTPTLDQKVRLFCRSVERDTFVPLGSVGTVIKRASRAVLVTFPQGERWCWPSELVAA